MCSPAASTYRPPSSVRSAAQDEARRRVRDFGSRREYFVDGNRYIAKLRRERSRRPAALPLAVGPRDVVASRRRAPS